MDRLKTTKNMEMGICSSKMDRNISDSLRTVKFPELAAIMRMMSLYMREFGKKANS